MKARSQLNVSVPAGRTEVLDKLRAAAEHSHESRSELVVDAVEGMAELVLHTHRSSRELLSLITEDPARLFSTREQGVPGHALGSGAALYVAALNAALPQSWRASNAFADVADDRDRAPVPAKGRIAGTPALDVDWQR
jgi:uncharacterized protein (DUF1778 family)